MGSPAQHMSHMASKASAPAGRVRLRTGRAPRGRRPAISTMRRDEPGVARALNAAFGRLVGPSRPTDDELISSRRRVITLRAVASVSSSSTLAASEPTARPLIDRLAIAVLVAIAGIALMTFRDYGLGWDDYTHSEYGEQLRALYGSGFPDRRALTFVNLYMYGGGFDMLAALAAKVSPFTLFETRRLAGALVGLIGLLATWRTGRRIGGPLAGFMALALLATCPLYIGHMFMNAKDAPFAVAMAILLVALVRVLET